uniref:Uncharacterized protein n=1 Tax=Cacopsylla melanoneura TaxID=428564 RepID=A0A8D8TSG6_9HEMI
MSIFERKRQGSSANSGDTVSLGELIVKYIFSQEVPIRRIGTRRKLIDFYYEIIGNVILCEGIGNLIMKVGNMPMRTNLFMNEFDNHYKISCLRSLLSVLAASRNVGTFIVTDRTIDEYDK